MKHFIEITLLPEEEIPIHFLWEKVYQQLHLALVDVRPKEEAGKVGIAFPEYVFERRCLGSKVRLLAASEAVLASLKLEQWLSRLQDYVHIKRVHPVPENVEHRLFKRVQTKSSVERLARRYAKHKQISESEALKQYKKRKMVCSSAPFIRIKSQSSGEHYRLMIACEVSDQAQKEGGFSSYGLSSTRTVPHF